MLEFLEIDWLEFKSAFEQAKSMPEKFQELNIFYMSECYLHGLQPEDNYSIKQIIDHKIKLMTEAQSNDERVKISFLISGLCIGWAMQ